MKFTITAAALCRLASIPAFFEPGTDPEIVQQLGCVRLENNQGRVLAISTNEKIAAVEYLGQTTEPDGAMHLTIDAALIEQARKEIPFNGFVEVNYIPEILVASVKTMLGFIYQGNPAVGIPENSPLKNWRKWFPDKMAKKSNGAMYWNADHVQTLAAASPSGKVVFPEHIDIDYPVVIRDIDAKNWVGCFMGKVAPSEVTPAPATLPEWI